MHKLKQLASDTVIYGVSSILGRVVFVLLTRLYTNTDVLAEDENGVLGIGFSLSAFLLVFFGYGLETAFFRYALKEKNNLNRTLATALTSITITTLVFGGLFLFSSGQIAALVHLSDYSHIIRFVILIVAFDTLTSIPFAYLRAVNRPIRFAVVKLLGIFVNVGANLFFYLWCPQVLAAGPDHSFYQLVAAIYNPAMGVGYAFIANIIGSAFQLVLLSPVFAKMRGGFDKALLGKMLRYGWPIMIVLLGSMINEVADRQLLNWLLPGTEEEVRKQVGIYQSCYKLSVFLSLFTQAFRYAGEPFFFSRAKDKNSKKTYALVLKYFTIFSLLGFLFVSLNLNVLKHILIHDAVYFQGLSIVPVLLMAYVFAGIYYNLSIWYKLSDNTFYGAVVAIIGAIVTIGLNLVLIPQIGYMGSAWATFSCFFIMSVVAYFWGQKVFPVPYNVSELVAYILGAFILYMVAFPVIQQFPEQSVVRYLIQIAFLLVFVATVFLVERKQLYRLIKQKPNQ